MSGEELVVQCPKCPEEKTPKMYINTSKGVFNCFRCGFKGKLHLLKEFPELLSSIEDKQILAKHIRYSSFSEPVKMSTSLVDSLGTVHQLTPSSPEYSYLLSRGWTEDMIYVYRPIVSSVSRFKDRVIVPIFNLQDEMIFYVSRDITNLQKDKYINSISPKDNVLFYSNLEASVFYSSLAFIGEGIFDMAKVPNSVALLGKTVNKMQYSALFNFLKTKQEVYLCLDANTEHETEMLYSLVSKWLPSLSVFKLNRDYFKDADIGDLAKTHTEHELVSLIKSNSSPIKSLSLTEQMKAKLVR